MHNSSQTLSSLAPGFVGFSVLYALLVPSQLLPPRRYLELGRDLVLTVGDYYASKPSVPPAPAGFEAAHNPPASAPVETRSMPSLHAPAGSAGLSAGPSTSLPSSLPSSQPPGNLSSLRKRMASRRELVLSSEGAQAPTAGDRHR